MSTEVAAALCGLDAEKAAAAIPAAKDVTKLAAEETGFVSGIHAEKIGRAALLLGAGRQIPTGILGN